MTPVEREQPWRDDTSAGRVWVLTRNPISVALEAMAAAAGRDLHVVDDDGHGAGLVAFRAFGATSEDAVVLCDHDAPDAPAVLRAALGSPASYVAMLASRRRAEGVFAELVGEGMTGLERLHMPAGLDLGGRAPGEIALSVLAQIVADSHGRTGGPMGTTPAGGTG